MSLRRFSTPYPGFELFAPACQAALVIVLLFAATIPMARGQTDGASNTTYQPPIPGGSVFVILPTADGSAYYGGDFTTMGAVNCTGLVRLAADGSLDTTFVPVVVESNTNVVASVQALATDSSGNLLVGGQFTSINGVACGNLARLAPDGSVDKTFSATIGSGLSTDIVRALEVGGSGNIIVGGNFVSVNGTARSGLALLLPSGSLYPDWNSGTGVPAGETVKALFVQNNGDVVIGGSFDSLNGVARNGLARVTAATGALDFTFDANLVPLSGSSLINVISVVAQPDGSLLVGGVFGYPSGSGANLIRLTSNGIPDPSFYCDIDGSVAFSAVQTDGRILIGGTFSTLTDALGNSVTLDNAARLFSDGSVDKSFAPDTLDYVDAFALLTSGNLLIGEYAEKVGIRWMLHDDIAPSVNSTPALPNQIVGLIADLTGLAEFVTTSYNVDGNAGSLAVEVKRSGTFAGSVGYSSSDGSTNGTLSWMSGDTSTKSFSLPITASANAVKGFKLPLLITRTANRLCARECLSFAANP